MQATILTSLYSNMDTQIHNGYSEHTTVHKGRQLKLRKSSPVYHCITQLRIAVFLVTDFIRNGERKTLSSHINQSILVFCPRAGLSLQTQHSPLYPLLSLLFRFFIKSIYHNVVYHLISSSAANFLPVYHSFWSIPHETVPSQSVPSQFLLFFISSIIILPSPTLSNTTAFFILSVHFTRSILLHIHI